MNTNTIVVNCFAGPGAGKTTCAWEIASELKKRNIETEYVSEYAKELVWDNNTNLLDGSLKNQREIYNIQNHRVQRLIGKVDVIVTDSPALLSAIYLKESNNEFEKEMLDDFKQQNNFNLFIERGQNFQQVGRLHNLEKSRIIDETIKTFLDFNKINYGMYNHSTIKDAIKDIQENLNVINNRHQDILPSEIKSAQELKRDAVERLGNNKSNDLTVGEVEHLLNQKDIVAEITIKESDEAIPYTDAESFFKDYRELINDYGINALFLDVRTDDFYFKYQLDEIQYGEYGVDVGTFEQWYKDKERGITPFQREQQRQEAYFAQRQFESVDFEIKDKYELTDESIIFQGCKLYRIKALKDFADVCKGDLGGFVESSDNLLQTGNCWVYDDAKVFADAFVSDNAIITDNAVVKGDAGIFGNVEIRGDAIVTGKAVVKDFAIIRDNALVTDNTNIYGTAVIDKDATVVDNAHVYDHAYITDSASVQGGARVGDRVKICGKKHLCKGKYEGNKTLNERSSEIKNANRNSIRSIFRKNNESHSQGR